VPPNDRQGSPTTISPAHILPTDDQGPDRCDQRSGP
jgi:hypothetical protein